MKQTRVAIYTRVSTDDQSTSTQEHELRQYAKHRGWMVQWVYTDHGFSGASEKRPALDELLGDTRKRKFDVVLVWKFDRFARSLRQLVSALELFRKFGIDFVSATEAIDTSLPSGELVFQIFGAIAQFERALIGERVRAGLGEARRNGKRIGRPPIRTLTQEERVRIRMEHRNGKSLRNEFGDELMTALTNCGVLKPTNSRMSLALCPGPGSIGIWLRAGSLDSSEVPRLKRILDKNGLKVGKVDIFPAHSKDKFGIGICLRP